MRLILRRILHCRRCNFRSVWTLVIVGNVALALLFQSWILLEIHWSGTRTELPFSSALQRFALLEEKDTSVGTSHEITEVALSSSQHSWSANAFSNVSTQAIVQPPGQHPHILKTTTNTWVIFYHIFIPRNSPSRADKALQIVQEQLTQIEHSYYVARLRPNNSDIKNHTQPPPLLLYTTIGQRILPEAMKDLCEPRGIRCVNMQALSSGYEDKTLRQVHTYCSRQHNQNQNNVVVTYLHNKGSHHDRAGANDLWRTHMTMAVTSRACYSAVVASQCHACGLLFQALPSWHFPGNFWTARCDYVHQLLRPSTFATKLEATLQQMDELVAQSILTRQLYGNHTEDWTTGRGRYGHELWIASHFNFQPCDVSSSPDLRYWKTALRSESDFEWHLFPRRPLLDKHWQIQPRPVATVMKHMDQRLLDYHLLPGMMVRWWGLYRNLPSPDSWVFEHMPDGTLWREWMIQMTQSSSSDTALTKNRSQTLNFTRIRNVLSLTLTNKRVPPPMVPAQKVSPFWTVFYHVYIPSGRNVSHIIDEQLQTLSRSHVARARGEQPLQVYFSSVSDGSHLPIDVVSGTCQHYSNLQCKLVQREQEGNENLTLTAMHQHCFNNPDHSVIYFHSKGSYHDSVENQYWRRHLLSAITSADCLESTQGPGSSCNVCGLQFYPVFANFFPGNFFVSHCSYISKLLAPNTFANGMDDLVEEMMQLKKESFFRTDLYNPHKEGTLGLNRYAWEHWVGSHPSLRPCDLSRTANLRTWVKPSYPTNKTAAESHDFQWSLAPRGDIWAPWYRIQMGKRTAVMADKDTRLREYFLLGGLLFKWNRLYPLTPVPDNSWIYDWFPDGRLWQNAVTQLGTAVMDVLIEFHRQRTGLSVGESLATLANDNQS